MPQSPLLSVFIPAYNAAAYVREAVESVLDNGFGDFEVVIVDDGSTDDTARVVEALRHPAVRFTRQPQNLGVGRTRRAGMALVRGRYVAMLDADDIAVGGRFERQVARLETPDGPDILGGGIEFFGDERGRIDFPANDAEIRAGLLFFDLPLANGAACMRMSHLREGRVAYSEGSGAEDYALWADAMMAGLRFENLPEVVTRVRRHRLSLTRSAFDTVVAQGCVVRMRIAQHYFPAMSDAEREVLVAALSSNMSAGRRWMDAIYALSHAAMLAGDIPRVDTAALSQRLENSFLRLLKFAREKGGVDNETLELMTETDVNLERWRAADNGALDARIMALFAV